MNFGLALIVLKNGGMVKRKNWGNPTRLKLSAEGVLECPVMRMLDINVWRVYLPTVRDVVAEDWERVEAS